MKSPFLAVVLLATVGIAAERPNIVMIMADDLGYECIGANGSEMYDTPHIDKLAAEGMRFQHAHSQPICTPSRVQLMTGLYNNRNYIEFGVLDPEEVTFGNVFRDDGYETCIAGKWQLGGGFEGPVNFGFDHVCLWQLTRRPSRYPNPGLEIDGEEQDFKNGEFGPDLVSDYIVDFLENRDQEKPFFVYYPMIAPHWPFVPTPDSEDWDPTLWRDAKSEPKGFMDQTYWADDVAYTDKVVGKVVDALDSLGLRENTLVIFTGDNGTATQIVSQFGGESYPGGKGSTNDRGTHVPFVASWPGTIQAGSVSDELVDFSDLFPTFLDAAGISEQGLNLDGVSLMPTFTGEGERKKDYIYCWYERNGVREKASQHVRDREFKLYADDFFYDLRSDPWEEAPLEFTAMTDVQEAAYERLSEWLAPHLAITEKADPVQAAKRTAAKKKSKKEKKQ